MLKNLVTKGFCVAVCFGWLGIVSADNGGEPSLDIGWLLFGDFYHVPSHHNESGDGATGLVLRRGYLTFDADLGKKTFGRVRFELNQSGKFETYTYSADFKDLYLGWNLGKHKLIAGLTSTVTYDLIESMWGYRSLVRTPLDLQGIPSRDTGVSLKGPLNADGSLGYRAMLGTEIEFGADSSGSTKWSGALTWKPTPLWTIDLYADFEEFPGPGERSMLQAFVGYKAEYLRWGLQYSNQDRQESPPLELASVFVVRELGESASLIGRIDRLLEPSPRGDNISYLPFDPSAKATMFISGVEFRLRPWLSLTPNMIVTSYDRNDQGVRPKTDLYLRLTLFINFE